MIRECIVNHSCVAVPVVSFAIQASESIVLSLPCQMLQQCSIFALFMPHHIYSDICIPTRAKVYMHVNSKKRTPANKRSSREFRNIWKRYQSRVLEPKKATIQIHLQTQNNWAPDPSARIEEALRSSKASRTYNRYSVVLVALEGCSGDPWCFNNFVWFGQDNLNIPEDLFKNHPNTSEIRSNLAKLHVGFG